MLRMVLAAALSALAWAGPVLAQQGRVTADDPSRDRDQAWFYLDQINNLTLAKGQEDSTDMKNTTGWKYMALWLYADCNGGGTAGNCDSIFYATYAIQVRGNNTALNDSISAHPWSRIRPGSANACDTVGTFSGMFAFDSLTTRADPNTEFLVVATVSPEKGRSPFGQLIPISNPNSEWKSSNFTSIRIRAIDVFNASGVVFRGTSPDNRTRVRLDMFGWR